MKNPQLSQGKIKFIKVKVLIGNFKLSNKFLQNFCSFVLRKSFINNINYLKLPSYTFYFNVCNYSQSM